MKKLLIATVLMGSVLVNSTANAETTEHCDALVNLLEYSNTFNANAPTCVFQLQNGNNNTTECATTSNAYKKMIMYGLIIRDEYGITNDGDAINQCGGNKSHEYILLEAMENMKDVVNAGKVYNNIVYQRNQERQRLAEEAELRYQASLSPMQALSYQGIQEANEYGRDLQALSDVISEGVGRLFNNR